MEIKREDLVQMMYSAKAFKEPVVAQYLEAAERKLFEAWKHSPAGDREAREVLYLQCLGLEEFRNFLRMVIIKGEMAEKELNDKVAEEKSALTNRNALN